MQPARAAIPDPSPAAVLARTLEARLRSEQQAAFAGLVLGRDGVLEVLTVGSDARVTNLVNEIRLAVAPQAGVRIVAEQQNSLATLEQLRDQITASREAFAALGITIVEWGVDIRVNRVRVGLLDPTPAATALLTQKFGADRISVVKGHPFSATGT
jgi:hypothetical protein